VYVSPYNDADVVAGQGTVARELLKQIPDVEAVFVAVGGGGLGGGIAAYCAAQPSPRPVVVGCQPSASPVMARSVDAGTLLDLPSEDSISDATVGLVEAGSMTFPLCRDHIAEWVLVDEPAIRDAVRFLVTSHSILVEGAGALPVASLRARPHVYRGKTVALVLSGSHIKPDLLSEILAGTQRPPATRS
jgi:threonine dehydratase